MDWCYTGSNFEFKSGNRTMHGLCEMWVVGANVGQFAIIVVAKHTS